MGKYTITIIPQTYTVKVRVMRHKPDNPQRPIAWIFDASSVQSEELEEFKRDLEAIPIEGEKDHGKQ